MSALDVQSHIPHAKIRPLLGPHLSVAREGLLYKLFLLLTPGNYPLFIYLGSSLNSKLQTTGQMLPSAWLCIAHSCEDFAGLIGCGDKRAQKKSTP